MKIYLGKTSNNEPVLREVSELPVLFVVYNHKNQWDTYLKDLFLINELDGIAQQWTFFRIVSRYRITDLSGKSVFNHLKEIEEYLTKKIRSAAKLDKGYFNTFLVIDDIFQLKLFDNKKATKLFLLLLEKGEQQHIYLLIGTSGLFRGLLSSLMAFSFPNSTYRLSTRFSELVINEDDLLFFREKASGTFIRYF